MSTAQRQTTASAQRNHLIDGVHISFQLNQTAVHLQAAGHHQRRVADLRARKSSTNVTTKNAREAAVHCIGAEHQHASTPAYPPPQHARIWQRRPTRRNSTAIDKHHRSWHSESTDMHKKASNKQLLTSASPA